MLPVVQAPGYKLLESVSLLAVRILPIEQQPGVGHDRIGVFAGGIGEKLAEIGRKLRVAQRGLGAGLDQRAIDAVRQWRFAPATRLGTPVDVIVEAAVEVKLP